jgi:hypothetical protein
MNAYELMIKTNHHLIKGGELTAPQKANIVRQLLDARSDDKTKQSFYKGVKYTDNIDSEGDVTGTYPGYYIPPYNGNKKYQTVIPMSPKTHILSANSYELEIIRLLYLFAQEDSSVKDMIRGTLKRLKTACFANECVMGECFHTLLPVLRFLAAVKPDDKAWLNKLAKKYNKHFSDAKRHSGVTGYYGLCLSELPIEIAEPEIMKRKDEMLRHLTRSSVMNSENDKINNPVWICMTRNCLCRLPEYEYIKNRQPYLNDKDGRLYFDMQNI